jgi:Aminoglycoside adenylyltransferase, C-terminal domain
MLEGVEEVRPGIETGTDTTNGLLTLARIWFTLATGEMAPKDMAADWAIARLAGDDRTILERARGMYLGEVPHGWRGLEAKARVTGERLAGQALRTAQQAGIAGVGEHSRQ